MVESHTAAPNQPTSDLQSAIALRAASSTQSASAQSAGTSPSSPRAVRVAATALVLVLLLSVPQFLRMPLTNDPVYFDLQASLLRHDGVLYRDYVEPNFPGVVWIQAALRPLIGASSEGLRTLDLIIFVTTAGLCGWGVRRLTDSTAAALGCLAAQCGFYFSLAEWSHCQRDVWLLLPATLAVTLRWQQLQRIFEPSVRGSKLFGFGGLEGLAWGAGVWLKPHVMIVGLAVWIVGAFAARRSRSIAVDAAGLLTGGLVAGALGFAWLRGTGVWPYFWESVTQLAPEYAAAGRRNWAYSGFLSMGFRLAPWGLLHVVASPLALLWLWRAARAPRPTNANESAQRTWRTLTGRGLWAAFYLAWTVQALFLQILFDYVHVPGIVLAVVLTCVWLAAKTRPLIVKVGALAFVVTACLASPLPNLERLALWPRCVVGPNSPELMNRLRQIREPDWSELERVAGYLQTQNVHDGELIAYGNHLIHLYPRLDVRPTNRYVYQAWYLSSLPNRREEIRRDLAEHPPRFIVSDLASVLGRADFSDQPGIDGPDSLPAGIPEKFLQAYPLRYPVVFRAGGLLVHRYEKAEPKQSESEEPKPDNPSEKHASTD